MSEGSEVKEMEKQDGQEPRNFERAQQNERNYSRAGPGARRRLAWGHTRTGSI